MRTDLLATAAPVTETGDLAVPVQVSASATAAMQSFKIAAAFAILFFTTQHPALAQDVLGIASGTAQAILVVKALCGLATVICFFAMMGGRHEKAALVTGLIGLFGVYKADAIVALAGG